jgi:hypothetical protein
LLESLAVGVGHSFRPARAVFVEVAWFGVDAVEGPGESVEPLSASVADDEDAGAAVRSTDIGRAKVEPLRIPPADGKVCQHAAKPSLPQHGHVLPDAPLGLELVGDADALGPEPPWIGCTSAGPDD